MTFTVFGVPAPKGSKSFKGMRKGHAIMVESSKALPAWDEAVYWAAVKACGTAAPPLFAGNVSVSVVFTLPRPKSVSRHVEYVGVKPDADKLLRAVYDAMTRAGVWVDDSRVVAGNFCKCYPIPAMDSHFPMSLDRPGCVITVEAL